MTPKTPARQIHTSIRVPVTAEEVNDARKSLRPATLEMVVAEVGAQFNAALQTLKHGGVHVNGRYRPPTQPEVSARTVSAALAANGFAFPEGAAK